jgi:plastocyanin
MITMALAVVLAASAPAATDVATLQADVARLQQELREQKQLLLQFMQVDQQRYDMLLQIIRTSAQGGPAPALPAVPGLPTPPRSAEPAAEAAKVLKQAGTSGTITGHLRVPHEIADAYVYVDGTRGASGRGKVLQIQQKGKQFSPQVAVVAVGTRLAFPNLDAVYHNVFSRSPGNAFDLGGIKAGEKPGSVVVTQPGHVEIFCNIHSKMRADVLVVPSGHYTKVRPDGSFELTGVPIGSRKVVLWSPSLKPASQRVEVTPEGASVTFAPELEPVRPHTNKAGQPYGSYDE